MRASVSESSVIASPPLVPPGALVCSVSCSSSFSFSLLRNECIRPSLPRSTAVPYLSLTIRAGSNGTLCQHQRHSFDSNFIHFLLKKFRAVCPSRFPERYWGVRYRAHGPICAGLGQFLAMEIRLAVFTSDMCTDSYEINF